MIQELDYIVISKAVPSFQNIRFKAINKYTIGGFRFAFDSVFEPSSNLIYHAKDQRIESIGFNYEKINHSSIDINNLVNFYQEPNYQECLNFQDRLSWTHKIFKNCL